MLVFFFQNDKEETNGYSSSKFLFSIYSEKKIGSWNGEIKLLNSMKGMVRKVIHFKKLAGLKIINYLRNYYNS